MNIGIKMIKLMIVVVAATFCLISQGYASALLIEDILPWDYNSNSQTLTDIGIPFVKINSNDIATTDFTPYQFVVFASVQNQPFYDNIKTNFSKIDNYVQGGGILIAHSALWGWPGNGLWYAPDLLPGGVDRVQEYSNSVHVTDPSSPIISGPYGTLSAADFQAWDYSTHGYFTDLVAGTHIIIDLNDLNKPCYIEYDWGNGLVRATMMTVEWGQNDANNTRYIFRENEFYAAANPVQPIPEPATMLLLGSGLVGLAGFARRRFLKK